MSDGLQALYPFLYGGGQSLDDLRAEMVAATTAKLADAECLRNEAARVASDHIAACAADMHRRFERGGRLWVLGNGGSATDAAAVARLFCTPPHGRPLPAVSLADDSAPITAVANDAGFDSCFARPLAALAGPADMALALSTSGSSPNLLRALDAARGLGLLTIGLAGHDGGRMAEAGLAHLLIVDASSVHRIQEVQTTLVHLLWRAVQALI